MSRIPAASMSVLRRSGLRVPPEGPSLRVLASGSGGNCTIVSYKVDGWTRFSLIDAGLSPKRALPLIYESGLTPGQLDAIILTHLDQDHWHQSWARARPPQARLILHPSHARSLGRHDRLHVQEVGEATNLAPGVRLTPALGKHDDHGSAVYRLEFAPASAATSTPTDTPVSLGFATDVGEVDAALATHLASVDVLAIESNYCPRMQRASSRPAFLKHRIMGGAGHLSNEQAIEAIRAIAPRQHVVLLHLSRQCNSHDHVAQLHSGATYGLTIASQFRPTDWVPIGAANAREPSRPVQMQLF